jgi:hypothetical protein
MSAANCFLCRFSCRVEAVDMNQYAEDNIGTMHPDVIAHEIHRELNNRAAQLMDNEGEIMCMAMSEAEIKRHIYSHTLNPVVRTGIMLRNLVELDDKMKSDMYKVDNQGQCVGLEPKMIDTYLRLQNQMMNLYRGDLSKMPFRTQHADSSMTSSRRPDGAWR